MRGPGVSMTPPFPSLAPPPRAEKLRDPTQQWDNDTPDEELVAAVKMVESGKTLSH